MLTKLTWPSLAESIYNFCSTLVAFRSFILCFLDGYNIALCNDELYLVKGGPASGSIISNIYKVILQFIGYYNDKNIEMMNIYNTIKDIAKELNIEFDNVLKLFKNKFINNDIYVNSTINEFIDYDYYEDIIIKFNELSYDIKESLSEFLNFDEKYDRSVYLEICNLISCQIDKVTKSFEILTENDVEIVLNEIIKTVD